MADRVVFETDAERQERLRVERIRQAVRDGIVDAVHELAAEVKAGCSVETLQRLARALEAPRSRAIVSRFFRVVARRNANEEYGEE